MIAAIYARKSTEQTGVADDAKSVTRQVEHARADLDADLARVLGALLVKWYRADVTAGEAGGHDG